MEVEVVLLGERSTEEVLRWTVADRSRVASIHWRHLALDLVRRARSGRQRVGEIYLCYRGERIEEYYDHDLLEILITLSREHAWGSSVHVVLDSRDPVPGTVGDCHDSREEWFRTALRMGVADFLQVRIDPSGLEPVDTLLLRSACDRARSIAESLGSTTARDVWEVALASEGRQRERCRAFLGSFVRTGGLAHPGAHLLILVTDLGESSQRDSVEEILQRFQPGRASVATVGLLRPEAFLWEYCRDRGLGLVRFRGLYELKYFLLRSRADGPLRAVEPPRALPPRSPAKDEFTYYEDGLQGVFQRIEQEHPRFRQALVYEERLKGNIRKARRNGDTDTLMAQRAEIIDRWNELALAVLGVPFNRLCEMGVATACAGAKKSLEADTGGSLLVTTSLDPSSQEDLCLLAARITGQLLKEVPPSVVPLVHLAITRSALGDMIDGMPVIAGWIFLGLAAGEQGLQEASSSDFVLAEEWSACFGRLETGFPLALFLAGRSAETARRFVGSGVVACAIGFEGPVLAEDFAYTAKRILQTVFGGQGDRGLIETIMRQGSQGGAFFAEGR